MNRFRMRNLVTLVYAPNTCYTDLKSGVPKDVEVNTEDGTWTHSGRTYKIGESGMSCPVGGYPIGVYDRTKIEHLRSITFEAGRVQSGPQIED